MTTSIFPFAIVVAVITEALVEYGSTIYKAFVAGEAKTAIKQIAAIVIAVILCSSLGCIRSVSAILVTWSVTILDIVIVICVDS